MIIQCDQCKTRFRLADEKISAKGVRVRCTKCQHTFVVRQSLEMAIQAEPGAAAPAPSAKPEKPDRGAGLSAAVAPPGPEAGGYESASSVGPSLDDMFGPPIGSDPLADPAGPGTPEVQEQALFGDLGLGQETAAAKDPAFGFGDAASAVTGEAASEDTGASASPATASDEEMDAALSALDFGAGTELYDPPLPGVEATAPADGSAAALDGVFGTAPPASAPEATAPSEAAAPSGLDLDAVFGAPADPEPPQDASSGGWDFDFSAVGASGEAAAVFEPAGTNPGEALEPEPSLGEGGATADVSAAAAAEGALAADSDPFGGGFELSAPPGVQSLGGPSGTDPFASLDLGLARDEGEEAGVPELGGGRVFSPESGSVEAKTGAAGLSGLPAAEGGAPAAQSFGGATPLAATSTGAVVPASVLPPTHLQAEVTAANTHRLGTALVNGVFVAFLALVLLGSLVAARTQGPIDVSLYSLERMKVALSGAGQSLSVVSTTPGRYETAKGEALIYVRGEVLNNSERALERPAVEVAMRGPKGTLLARVRGVVGAPARAEALFNLRGPEDLEALLKGLGEEAPLNIPAHGRLPYLAVILSIPDGGSAGLRFETQLAKTP